MNSLLADFIPTLGWVLIDFLWQGIALGLATAIVLAVLRNARPQARYAVACIALALCVLLPATGLLLGLQGAESGIAQARSIAAQANLSQISAIVAPIESWRDAVQSKLSWIVVGWSFGAGLLALRMALGFAWVSRVSAHAGACDPGWQLRLDALAPMFGIDRSVRLRVAEDLDGPVAAGWWRPVVLVPSALLAHMPADLLEALLAHELAHIKRHDYLVNLMQSAIEALLFYHPVVWWLSRRIRIEREQIADDLALQALGEPRRLALALQQLDRFQAEFSQPSNPHLAPAAHGGNLMTRIQRLLRPTEHALTWKMALPILGLSALCFAFYAQAGNVTGKPEGDEFHGTLHLSGHTEDAYAMVRQGEHGIMLSGDIDDIGMVKRLRSQVQGDFLWFRRGSTTYLVQDPVLLGKARQAWAPTEPVSRKMDALSEQMRPHSEKMDALGKQMEAASERGEPSSKQMEAAGKRMEPLGRQQEALGRKMEQLADRMQDSRSAAERERLGREMEALGGKMEQLGTQMKAISAEMERHGKAMERAHEPMEALGRQMEAAAAPMEALGEQMEVLGEEQERLSQAADKQTKRLIEEALRSGKAVPTKSLVSR